MNTRSSSYTGRAPRTLNEAFGPHQDYISEPAKRSRYPEEEIIIGISAVAFLCVVALIAYEYLGGIL